MTVSPSGNASLDRLVNSYQAPESRKTEKEDELGRDAFLTMLVAQLQNQDPLNPMEGSDFSAQLAQFSQLEQLMALNDSMESLSTSFASDSEKDLISYMGMQVTGDVDTMHVSQGGVSEGFFSLDRAAEIIVEVTDTEGQKVKTIPLGTKGTGAHTISWDGTDSRGESVEDGIYTYSVLANTGSGYVNLPNQVTGKVEGVAYQNDQAYLVVQGVLIDPDKLAAVTRVQEDMAPVDSAMSYLGKTVSSDQPVIEVRDGGVSGGDLEFTLENPEAATVKVYDRFDNLVRTLQVDESDTAGGSNAVNWDGTGDSGGQVSAGLYYYTVQTASGKASTPVNEEVTGIRNTNGVQYLVLGESGRLASVSSVISVTQ